MSGPTSNTRPDETRSLRWAWRGALAFFVLAALTGAFFRFAVATGTPLGLNLGNVRHAHSHTMYFGWVTPALMALLAGWLPRLGAARVRGAKAAIGAAFVTTLLAYPPFLLWGYTSARFGDAELPLSVIASGLNVFAWYAFVAVYARARRGASEDGAARLALRLFDLSLWFLVLATVGAWGLPAMQVFGTDNHALMVALTRIFLDLFSEGWFVLGVLGLAAAEASRGHTAEPTALAGPVATWGVRLMVAGLPFTFALGMAPSLVPPLFEVLADIGGVLVCIGTLSLVAVLWRNVPGFLWRFALACLTLKALAEGAVSALPGMEWAAHPQLHILYIHLMLLGFVSVGIIAAARAVWGATATAGRRAFAIAVTALLISLIPLTPLWPAAWRGSWIFVLAALLALGPVLVALRMVAAWRPPEPSDEASPTTERS